MAEEAAKKAIRERVINCPAPQSLRDHCQEFNKEVIKVTDGVHVAVGFALANSILVEAPDGLIVVDTTEAVAGAKDIFREFRKISQKPLKGVIYTHSHKDHMGGTEAFLPDNHDGVEIWAHEKFMDIRKTYDALLKGVMTPRNIRQFGIGLSRMPGGVVNCGIGPKLNPSYADKFVWPNKLMKGDDNMDIHIAGLDLTLVYIPGETMCQMGVWIPSKKVFLPGDDFYKTFPNLYAIRGTVPRSVNAWIESLDKMRCLNPEYLVPSHTRPIFGQKEVQKRLTNYRDGIQFVHDQTVRLMNRGLHPIEVAKLVRLPPGLRDDPYLEEFYGTAEWSSRAVYDSYIGWFNGNPEDLFPHTPSQRAKKMVDSFGVDKILSEADVALTTEADPQWALELSTHVFLSHPNNEHAKEIRTRAILKIATKQTSANGRNYLLTHLLEDHGAHPTRYPTAKIVMTQPLDIVFKRMGCTIKAEEVHGLVMTVVIHFTDINETYSFLVRNSILEVKEVEADNKELQIVMDSNTLREILAGVKSVQDVHIANAIQIKGKDQDVLFKFFNCFEVGDV